MIDRSESHLIARERRNRGHASNNNPRAVRVRGFVQTGPVHEAARQQRVEPTVGDAAKTPPKHSL